MSGEALRTIKGRWCLTAAVHHRRGDIAALLAIRSALVECCAAQFAAEPGAFARNDEFGPGHVLAADVCCPEFAVYRRGRGVFRYHGWRGRRAERVARR